jgi:hypothetical protein
LTARVTRLPYNRRHSLLVKQLPCGDFSCFARISCSSRNRVCASDIVMSTACGKVAHRRRHTAAICKASLVDSSPLSILSSNKSSRHSASPTRANSAASFHGVRTRDRGLGTDLSLFHCRDDFSWPARERLRPRDCDDCCVALPIIV